MTSLSREGVFYCVDLYVNPVDKVSKIQLKNITYRYYRV